jgi:hypothetical protein
MFVLTSIYSVRNCLMYSSDIENGSRHVCVYMAELDGLFMVDKT